MAEITLSKVTKQYPDGSTAVHGVDIDIADGEFIILVGPSGCGKSTTLNMIAGLEDITSGELRIGGERVNERAPKDRDIAMVFQSYALYPHMSVRENIAFPLTLAKMNKSEIAAKVDEAAKILDLGPYLDRKPANLSGGQRQRVAMGRAIVRSPKAFLMDEPLSNLDAKLRVQMRTEIARLQNRLNTTTVYVTHDQTEAMTLGDRVVVLRGGYVQQIGTPQELYNEPANLFVAGFIGSPAMNFLPGRLGSDSIETPIGSISVPDHQQVVANAQRAQSNGEVLIGIRPEHLEDAALVETSVREKGATFTASVDVIENMGSDNYVYFSVDTPHATSDALSELSADAGGVDIGGGQMIARVSPESSISRGSNAELYYDTSRVAVFDQSSGANLRLA
ncbi:sn-glycerol-3-phosphate ABC transporter ATP-binding protein UgpC [Gordonia sp. Z-3]|uniref:Sn-glycerol-3-phosphate ABC transporter ATP-binding protein UgpC n=1 Tax=Gordonia tangerina TaxID=2911060 RepID=A0ABS9DJ63_9ACTN|nr:MULTISPECIES: sn-glycerol-3-phosphate ABC transporter ATP-binding protein UgpC [Gordonia]MAU83259.1 ABC transporter ATP-binding protein [Gordonia sp. (in: high G+C Gram-positive bacteria)]MAU83670.1 ABC transporter ATP-binding protein [Gordonia sp. (in: high G+C Gram-positive bacteria)]MCF3939101.1 sn-glycerol-3-phosphate ABC transporter ATP-binding protein UgpC [Gordonia tangerina]MED5801309.1 sn-glycerol-3-phosphate ABC transporter ATP-binding protein UgpC [Gordonia sp. Z-3]